MFGGSARTLGNLVGVASGGGWQNGGQQIVAAAAGSTQFWSFTTDRSYNSGNSCQGATSNNNGTFGIRGNSNSVDSDSVPGSGSTNSNCVSTTRAVLCLAR